MSDGDVVDAFYIILYTFGTSSKIYYKDEAITGRSGGEEINRQVAPAKQFLHGYT